MIGLEVGRVSGLSGEGRTGARRSEVGSSVSGQSRKVATRLSIGMTGRASRRGAKLWHAFRCVVGTAISTRGGRRGQV